MCALLGPTHAHTPLEHTSSVHNSCTNSHYTFTGLLCGKALGGGGGGGREGVVADKGGNRAGYVLKGVVLTPANRFKDDHH